MRQTDSTNGRGGKHRARRRLQPYAWLGAGAVTLGMGAALASGTAVAYADDGASGGSAKNASASSDSGSSGSTSSDSSTTAKKATAHSARSSKVSSSGGNTSAQDSSTAETAAASAAAATETSATTSSTLSSTEATSATETTTVKATAVAHSARVTTSTETTTSSGSSGAAAVLPAADPAPSMNSYLPTDPIVPGVAFSLGKQQLADAQTELNAVTWGSGNIAGGLAAIVPQLLLSSASATLNFYSATNSGAQGFFASTADIPIIHQLAGGNLLINILLPSLAGAEMSAAAFFLPLVGVFTGGTALDPVTNSLSASISNSRVYGFIPVSMKATTEPVVYISVNGGPSVPVLVDTGSSGLVISRNAVNTVGLGSPTGTGSATYSGAVTESYDYTDYTTTVDFGNGIVTDPTTVHIIDQADSAAFENFLSWGADGILGIGANAAGFAPNVPTAALPGELKDGVFLYQGLFFGVAGLMIVGQNPMPVRTSVPGAPTAYVQVQINNGTKTTVGSIIDSGGVYGTMLQSIASSVPAGTKISVYTADGSTLLYSYTVTSAYTAPTIITTGLINTGYWAFQQGPVYINYAAPDRIGSTDFDYA